MEPTLVVQAQAQPAKVEVTPIHGLYQRGSPKVKDESTVRLELKVTNRLSVPVNDVVVEIILLSSASTPSRPVPGWSFPDVRLSGTIGANGSTKVSFEQALPFLRNPPKTADIRYRVSIRSFLPETPSLSLAFELLGSPQESDQRAAFRSLRRSEYGAHHNFEKLASELRKTLRYRPSKPSATDALRMLLAIRTVGTLRLASEVDELLELLEAVDRDAWGKAVLELASQMVAVSQPEDPRLALLPRWGRRIATLLQVTASDALEDTTGEAILQVGDQAVPPLLWAQAKAVSPQRAQRLLGRLGRPTPELQLKAGDLQTRIKTIEALAQLGRIEAVPALASLLPLPGPLGEAAKKAILEIGEPAIIALAETLGEPEQSEVEAVLIELGKRHRPAIRELARLYGADVGQPEAIVGAVAKRRAWEQRLRVEADIKDAIRLGGQGAFRSALQQLKAARKEAPNLFLQYRDPVARIYLARGNQFYHRGDFFQALRTLEKGARVRALPEISSRLSDACAKLAGGYLKLGWLKEMEASLKSCPRPLRSDVVDLHAALFAERARRALGEGKLGAAHTAIKAALERNPNYPSVRGLSRTIFFSQHMLEIIVAGVLGAGAILILLIRHRLRSGARRLANLIKKLR